MSEHTVQLGIYCSICCSMLFNSDSCCMSKWSEIKSQSSRLCARTVRFESPEAGDLFAINNANKAETCCLDHLRHPEARVLLPQLNSCNTVESFQPKNDFSISDCFLDDSKPCVFASFNCQQQIGGLKSIVSNNYNFSPIMSWKMTFQQGEGAIAQVAVPPPCFLSIPPTPPPFPSPPPSLHLSLALIPALQWQPQAHLMHQLSGQDSSLAGGRLEEWDISPPEHLDLEFMLMMTPIAL